jgi:hypothetical protein
MTRDEVTVEHFRCECGLEGQKLIYDGLVAFACPVCSREVLTNLGRLFLRTLPTDGLSAECQLCGCKLDNEAIEADRDICFDCYCDQQD